ncbi:MAG: hypothetical protein JO325_20445, partial [Solirubrobacterales bacterium]|nr:hypothetical protein [Solirubrobacterales bacterium]
MRLVDGRVFACELAPERHRSLQIGLLHQETEGLVELAAGVRRDGRLQITTRRHADHFLPGGRSGGDSWRQSLLELAAQHGDRGEEVFIAPAARYTRRGDERAVCASQWLWVDVDQPGQLHAQPARIIEADLALAPYPIEQLVGDLPDPNSRTPTRTVQKGQDRDPYKRIGPPEYFEKLAGIVVPRDGLVSCPAPGHLDRNPSCSVGTSPDQGWCCHSGGCGARGAIYDLASVVLGGPGAVTCAARRSSAPAPMSPTPSAYSEPAHQIERRKGNDRPVMGTTATSP